MKYVFGIWLLVILMQTSCSKNTQGDCLNELNAPSCIVQKIEEIKAQPKWNPPAKISEYEYEGRKVYFWLSNCCDQFNPVYDSECKLVCYPSGGFSGGGDGKCMNFFSTATFIRVVWEDPR